MMYLITALMDCNSQREVDSLVEKNIFQIPGNQRAKLCQYANRRKQHIVRLNNQKKESWKEQLN